MSSGYEPIDNYEVANFIAGGGTSQVFEVIEPNTHRHLAMKMIVQDHPDVKEHKQTLKAEAAVCKQFDHPNVIHYEGFSNGRDHTYMLMEYFRAPTLKVQLKMDPVGVHLRLKKLLEGVCAALQHVHDKGFIHRDIKPENVLMNKVGEVRLIDFSLTVRQKSGLAKLFGGKQGTIQGTRTYIAPETIRKQQPVLQTDLYSLGVLLFEVLTGKTPFQAPTPNELLQKHLTAAPPNPSEFNKNVSPEMDRLVVKLLSKKPDQRGKDMAEVNAELRRIRYFKEEIQEPSDKGPEEKPSTILEQLAESKLDSRLDAQRSELVRANPELGAQLEEQKRVRKVAADAKKAKLAELKIGRSKTGAKSEPAPTPAPPTPPVAMPLQPPAYPFPQPQPGYGMPPQAGLMPGYPPGPGNFAAPPMGYPSGFPAQAPGMVPPMPGMPPAPPGPGFPNSPVPVTMPQVPVQARSPVSPVPQPAPAAARQPSNAPAAKPAQKPEEDPLEFMTELPDVL